ncbi:MAG: major capsid protein [Arizlama microvirus]|nr:MAG: major capsid protein [Arizlama microvirus]
MKSVMQHQFSQVPRVDIPRSVFDRSHGYKTTFDASYLIPWYCDEALPGDTFNARATIFARLATPIVPIMDNLHMDTFFFFVPNRLLWEHWQNFCGEQDSPEGGFPDYLVPTITAPVGGFTEGSIYDYMGVPTKVAGIEVNSLHFRAYNLIWNEWFRDENLQEKEVVNVTDSADPVISFNLLKRGKRHDYFTSCLPLPQKGPGVELPLGVSAPVWGIEDEVLNMWDGTNKLGTQQGTAFRSIMATPEAYRSAPGVVDDNSTFPNANIGVGVLPKSEATQGAISGLYADLSTATAATINSLREAIQLQRMYERDARGGSRYTELIRSHFGVVSPDARLQRPEYLGGSSFRISINPVQQTSQTGTTPQGHLAAYGLATDSSGGFSKSFTEHGVIIGLACVRADLTYQYGIPRMFSRQTRFDFYWPALAHLGEQEVFNKEIYAQGTAGNGDDDLVFGYQERFAEYRYFPSQITGLMRSNAATSLDVWHLSQEFSSLPELNDEFIEENVPLDRVVAVPSEPHIIFDSYMELKCARPMPVYSVPGMMDHF